MISVRNHRQRLNGNSQLFVVIGILILCACTPQKRTIDKPPVFREHHEVKPSDMVEQYDPVTGKIILVPRNEIKIDTVEWTVDETPPIVTDEDFVRSHLFLIY